MKQTVSSLLKTALACIDAIFLVLHSMAGILQQFYPNVYATILSYFVWGMKYLSGTASVFLIVAIAIERYYAVHYPNDYDGKDRKRVVKFVSGVCILAIALTASKFFEFRPQVPGKAASNETQYECDVRAAFAIKVKDTVVATDLNKGAVYRFYDAILFQLLITFIIPLVTLLFLYYKIYQRITATQSSVSTAVVKRSKRSQRKMKKEAALARIFAGFVITFLLSRSPSILAYLVFLASDMKKQSSGIVPLPLYAKMFLTINSLLITINSATNVLIYAGCSKQFRKECSKYFRKDMDRDKPGYSRGYSYTLSRLDSEENQNRIETDSVIIRSESVRPGSVRSPRPVRSGSGKGKVGRKEGNKERETKIGGKTKD